MYNILPEIIRCQVMIVVNEAWYPMYEVKDQDSTTKLKVHVKMNLFKIPWH